MPPANDDKLIRLGSVLDVVRTAIWTGRLAGDKPVSLCLIAEQESAKSQCLLYYHGTTSLHYFSDLTSKGVSSIKGPIEDRKVRHIVLLDLVRIVSHGRNVTDRTIQTLAGLMEEGEADSADAGGVERWKNLPQVGMLTSITPQFFRSKRGKWRDTGFLTRFLPVHFHYSDGTIGIIHKRIARGFRLPPASPENLPIMDTEVQISNEGADRIQSAAVEWGLANETYGFRHHQQLRVLAKARALMRGAKTVTTADIERVLSWRHFFSLNEPAIL